MTDRSEIIGNTYDLSPYGGATESLGASHEAPKSCSIGHSIGRRHAAAIAIAESLLRRVMLLGGALGKPRGKFSKSRCAGPGMELYAMLGLWGSPAQHRVF